MRSYQQDEKFNDIIEPVCGKIIISDSHWFRVDRKVWLVTPTTLLSFEFTRTASIPDRITILLTLTQ